MDQLGGMQAHHDRSGAMIPVAIHAHTLVCLPLLADFPKVRIDVNPFHGQLGIRMPSENIDIRDLAQRFPRSQGLPLLLFFDCHTINRVTLSELESWDNEIILFVGDTQHGAKDGLLKLMTLAAQPRISKLVFVNNPHHAHWFRSEATIDKEFLFFPLGLANYLIDRSGTSDNGYAKSVVHVGSIGSMHPRRKRFFDFFSNAIPAPDLVWLSTDSYPQANAIYANSLASLNVSLNSDLSFRIFEIVRSGGLCLSDRLGRIQADHFCFKDSPNFVEFDTAADLILHIRDLQLGIRSKRPVEKCSDSQAIPDIDGLSALARYSINISDVRDPFRSNPCSRETGDPLISYLRVRDLHRDLEHPFVTVVVNNAADFDCFLDILDLPHLKITVYAGPEFSEKLDLVCKLFPHSDIRRVAK